MKVNSNEHVNESLVFYLNVLLIIYKHRLNEGFNESPDINFEIVVNDSMPFKGWLQGLKGKLSKKS